jgi:hypothetical protein
MRLSKPDRRVLAERRQFQAPLFGVCVHNRAVHGARAARNIHALEGRPCRGGGDENLTPVRRHHLAVRAEINREQRLCRASKAEIREASRRVRADKAADERRERNTRVRWKEIAEEITRVLNRGARVGLERQHGQRARGITQQQMVHCRIADDGRARHPRPHAPG